MRQYTRFALLFFAVVSPACGGGSNTPATPAAPSSLLAVAGTYPTGATLVADRNTCGSVTVQDNATTVTHTAGSTEVALAHAGTTYRGTINPTGRFTTTPVNLTAADGDYTITLSGQFTTTGFTATVELTRRSATTCAYAVNWVGTKQGPPNTIPG